MRIAFRERPYDLFAVVVLSLVALGIIAGTSGGPARFVVGLLLVLFLPGYTIGAVVFPKAGDVGWIERLGLSLGLSIATVPILGLLLNETPWGVRLEPTIASLLLGTFGTCGIAYWRRMRLPAEERLAFALEFSLPKWKELAPLDKILAVAVAAALVASAGGLAFAVGTNPPGARFTEFYLLDSTGGVEAYPSQLNVDQMAVVIIGIANREGQIMAYTVNVTLFRVQYVYNSTTNRTDVIDLANSTLDPAIPVTLADGSRWERDYPFRLSFPGTYQLRFFLFVPTQATPYRLLQLPVEVV